MCVREAVEPTMPQVPPAANASAQRVLLSVLNQPLQVCCTSPMTGFFRDGYCRTDQHDHGRHVVCARVTDEFLQ
jgi:uncharacterized protein (DUF2237 family)